MSRGIKRVRSSIKRRKKKRDIKETMPTADYSFLLPQDEEKYGVYPPYLNYNQNKPKNKNRIHSRVWFKGIAALILFIGLSFILKSESDYFKEPQQWVHHYLNEEFPFAKVNDWYQTTFGTPLALFPQGGDIQKESSEQLSLPVAGSVTETFSYNGSGIMISPHENASVSAFNGGVVIFSGNDKHTNKTVTIQHSDNSKTTYGFLSSIDVHLYQLVHANQRIGSFSPTEENETVYFSIEQNNAFIDPIQVIEVDGIP